VQALETELDYRNTAEPLLKEYLEIERDAQRALEEKRVLVKLRKEAKAMEAFIQMKKIDIELASLADRTSNAGKNDRKINLLRMYLNKAKLFALRARLGLACEVSVIEDEVIKVLLEKLQMSHAHDGAGVLGLINKLKIIPGNTIDIAETLILLCQSHLEIMCMSPECSEAKVKAQGAYETAFMSLHVLTGFPEVGSSAAFNLATAELKLQARMVEDEWTYLGAMPPEPDPTGITVRPELVKYYDNLQRIKHKTLQGLQLGLNQMRARNGLPRRNFREDNGIITIHPAVQSAKDVSIQLIRQAREMMIKEQEAEKYSTDRENITQDPTLVNDPRLLEKQARLVAEKAKMDLAQVAVVQAEKELELALTRGQTPPENMEILKKAAEDAKQTAAVETAAVTALIEEADILKVDLGLLAPKKVRYIEVSDSEEEEAEVFEEEEIEAKTIIVPIEKLNTPRWERNSVVYKKRQPRKKNEDGTLQAEKDPFGEQFQQTLAAGLDQISSRRPLRPMLELALHFYRHGKEAKEYIPVSLKHKVEAVEELLRKDEAIAEEKIKDSVQHNQVLKYISDANTSNMLQGTDFVEGLGMRPVSSSTAGDSSQWQVSDRRSSIASRSSLGSIGSGGRRRNRHTSKITSSATKHNDAIDENDIEMDNDVVPETGTSDDNKVIEGRDEPMPAPPKLPNVALAVESGAVVTHGV